MLNVKEFCEKACNALKIPYCTKETCFFLQLLLFHNQDNVTVKEYIY